MDFGSAVSGLKFRALNSGEPWNIPQSSSSFFPAASTRYFDPVTVPAAPKNVSLAIEGLPQAPNAAEKRYRIHPQNKTGRHRARPPPYFLSRGALDLCEPSKQERDLGTFGHKVVYGWWSR